MLTTELLKTILIVCPMLFIAGLVDAIAGGGGLISLPAYLFAGLPIHSAIATNKMGSCMGTTVATVKYIKNRFVPWKLAPLCILGAFLGSSLGANLALHLSDRYFKLLLLVLVPVAGFYVLKKKNLVDRDELIINTKTIILSGLIALIVGVYDGFYGPGTGTFLLLLLTALTHLPLSKANGLTKVINWTTNFTALIIFLLDGQTIIWLGLLSGVFNIAGNYLGATLFTKKSGQFARPFMLFILIVFYGKLLFELFGS